MSICLSLIVSGSHLIFHAASTAVRAVGFLVTVAGYIGFEFIRLKEKEKLNATFGIAKYLNGFRIIKNSTRINSEKITVASFIKTEPVEENGEADDLS